MLIVRINEPKDYFWIWTEYGEIAFNVGFNNKPTAIVYSKILEGISPSEFLEKKQL
jgi:hypothetical protein